MLRADAKTSRSEACSERSQLTTITEHNLILELGFAIEDPLGVEAIELAKALLKFGQRIPPDQRRAMIASLDQQFSRQSRLQNAQNAASEAMAAGSTPAQAVDAALVAVTQTKQVRCVACGGAGFIEPNTVHVSLNLTEISEHVDVLVGEVAEQGLTRAHADVRLEQLMSYNNLQPYQREFVRGYFEGRLQMRRR